jgi:hypothetical protein
MIPVGEQVGVLADGIIQRVDRCPQDVDAEVEKHQEAGPTAAYLFAARNERGSARKKRGRNNELL